MKVKELRTLGDAELHERLNELARQLMKDRAKVAQGTALKSPGKIRSARRSIARIRTLLAQRARAPKPAPAPAQAPTGRKPEVPKKA
jgi:ribosomal protein L29